MTEPKELQIKEKKEAAAPAEQTRPGLVFTPEVDIFETEREITLLADMPGVAAEDVTIDLRDGVLSVSGEVKPWEGPDEKDVLVEFETGKYYRQFNLSEVIDQNRIEARLEDGVLRLTLAKAEKAVPRQIPVTAG
jgi:HSP20 family molecular chaperone IbpA